MKAIVFVDIPDSVICPKHFTSDIPGETAPCDKCPFCVQADPDSWCFLTDDWNSERSKNERPICPFWGVQGGDNGMDEKVIKAIESILAKDDRVELIPIKDGIKVIRIKREEVKV